MRRRVLTARRGAAGRLAPRPTTVTAPSARLMRVAADQHRRRCWSLDDTSTLDEHVVGLLERTAGGPPASPRGADRWRLIEHGRVVASSPSASAVPDGELTSAGVGPNRVRWRLHRTNGYGRVAVDASIDLLWWFGAVCDGAGSYIDRMCAAVVSDAVLVASGVDLEVDVVVRQPPPGSHGAHAGPATLPVSVIGQLVTPIGQEAFAWSISLRGDGSTGPTSTDRWCLR